MKTLVLEKPGKLSLVEHPSPTKPGRGEVLARVRRIGVCGTDIHAFHGRQPFFEYPRILGHELAVEIEAVGPGIDPGRIGQLCTVEPYLACGKCFACERGRTNCCENMQVLGVHVDGGMSERFLLPASHCHCHPDLSADQLALVEMLAIGCHAVERAAVQSGEQVLVIGAGPIGLSVVQFVAAAGAHPSVLDIHAGRLELCQTKFGVKRVLNAGEENIPERLRELCGGALPTVVFDATGNQRSMEAAFQYPAHGGRLVFVGLFPGNVSLEDPNFHRRELTLLASRNALSQDFPRILDLIASGHIDTSSWITHRASLDEVPQCFEGWTRPESGVLKAMIDL